MKRRFELADLGHKRDPAGVDDVVIRLDLELNRLLICRHCAESNLDLTYQAMVLSQRPVGGGRAGW